MSKMTVDIHSEHGYDFACIGLALNKDQDPARMPVVMKRLAGKGGGHDKFMYVIFVNLLIKAPRYWWQEWDAYKDPCDGVDGCIPTGCVSQSQSTMHTVTKRLLTIADFVDGTVQGAVDLVNQFIPTKDKALIKKHLAESFLQTRAITINYAGLWNRIEQRKTHGLEEWRYFCQYVKANVQHPELLPEI